MSIVPGVLVPLQSSRRDEFPEFLMVDHLNKLVMHEGEQAIRGEFERLMPLMQSGGFAASQAGRHLFTGLAEDRVLADA